MKKYLFILSILGFPFIGMAQTVQAHKGERVIKLGISRLRFTDAFTNKNNWGFTLEFLKRHTERFSCGAIYAFAHNNGFAAEERVPGNNDLYFTGGRLEFLNNHSLGAKADYAFLARENFRFSGSLSAGFYLANQKTRTYTGIQETIDGRAVYKKNRHYQQKTKGIFSMAQLGVEQYVGKGFFVGLETNAYLHLVEFNPEPDRANFLLNPDSFGLALTFGKSL